MAVVKGEIAGEPGQLLPCLLDAAAASPYTGLVNPARARAMSWTGRGAWNF